MHDLRSKASDALHGNRLMVCVTPTRQARHVLHAGAQLAKELDAVWYAVSVETPSTNDRGQAQQTRDQNFALADSLGAVIVSVKAESASAGLVAFAQREAVTHVVFGQRRSGWRWLRPASTADRFLLDVRAPIADLVTVDEGSPTSTDCMIHQIRREPHDRPRPSYTVRALAAFALIGACGLTAAFVSVIPWFLGFGVAIAVSVAWCIWLDPDGGN